MTFPAADTVDTYGGLFSDANPVEDPTTDLGAQPFDEMSASVAAMTNTCSIAWARFVTASGAASLTTTNSNGAAWGSAPGVRPTPSHVTTGVFDMTWPATIVDGTGATQSVNIKRAKSHVEGAAFNVTQCEVVAPNIVRVYTGTFSGLDNIPGTTIYVEVGG